jgi:hypothetical protein
LFIFLVGSSVFFLLKDGLLIDQITVAGLDIEKLYIKWDEKLTIKAEHAYVTKRNNTASKPFNPRSVTNAFRFIKFFEGFIGTVSIDKLRLGDAVGAFHYNAGSRNDLLLDTPNYTLDSTLGFKDDCFVFNIASFEDKNRDITLEGTIVVRLSDSKMFSKLNATIGTAEGLSLYLYSNRNALTFTVSADRPVNDLSAVVDAFALPRNISKWIVEYAAGDRVELKKLYGVVPYKDPSAVLRTLYGEATFHGLEYTFNPQSDPIRTGYTDLLFKDGILNIYPKEARYYTHDTGESWLNIDFTAERTLLTAYIKTLARLDQDMLNLLESYGIQLPFKQTEGKLSADLQLAITLATGDTKADGRFDVRQGRFRYQGLDLDVAKGAIALKNADVSVESLDISYGNTLHANVRGHMNPVQNDGHLKIDADAIEFGPLENPLALEQEKPLHIDYLLSKNGDTIIIEPSSWRYASHRIKFDAMQVPFDFSASIATLQEVGFSYNGSVRSRASGTVDFQQQLAALKLDIDKVDFDSLILKNAPLSFDLSYDGLLRMSASGHSVWDVNGTTLTLDPFGADVNATHLKTTPVPFGFGPDVNGTIATEYEFETSTAAVTFESLKLQHEDLGNYFTLRHPVSGLIHIQGRHTYAASEDIDMSYTAAPERWDLSLYSLERLSEHSALLRRYHLENGHLQLGRDYAYDLIGINGGIEYPYPLTVDDSGPVTYYEVLGQYTPEKLHLALNDTLQVTIADKIDIASKNIGYNLGAILQVINANDSDNQAAKLPELSLNAKNSFIYFTPQRRALADTISLYTNDSGLYARLKHRDGMAIFELKNNKFYLYGTRFGDLFMRHLLALAEYRGGELSFHVNGTTSEAHGVMRINNTVIKDYKLMNNILAFINTVPSLATFSLPHYSDKGMEVKNAYASFHYNDGLVKVDGVKVDSQEIDIAGNGVIDYVKETVDMKLNLITDAGENVSKIPIVGYILVGEKGDVTTTLKISGNMNDPKVSSDIAKGIVVAPFKMILRTITLPFSIFDKDKKKKK